MSRILGRHIGLPLRYQSLPMVLQRFVQMLHCHFYRKGALVNTKAPFFCIMPKRAERALRAKGNCHPDRAERRGISKHENGYIHVAVILSVAKDLS